MSRISMTISVSAAGFNKRRTLSDRSRSLSGLAMNSKHISDIQCEASFFKNGTRSTAKPLQESRYIHHGADTGVVNFVLD